jgi:hypothetical protein
MGACSHLRPATIVAHDLLDYAIAAAGGWQNSADDARFCALQHAARAPLSNWLRSHTPAARDPLHQRLLIACEPAALDKPVSAPAPVCTLGRIRTSQQLGVAWLAGSALGNRSIGRQVRRIG